MSETISIGTDIEVVPNLPAQLTEDDKYSSPIVIRELTGKLEKGDPSFKKTAMSGSLVCDDDRNDSTMIFLTAYRSGDPSAISHYYNGYGIALRMLTTEGQTANKLSLFVVDNSLADRNVILENVLHTGWGDYAYLYAMSYPFSADTQYNYRLKFLDNGGLEFYVWDPTSGPAPALPTISYGAYSNIQSSGAFYGMSCSHTGGHQTTFKSLSLANLDPSYPFLYCHIDGTDMPSEFSVVANAWAGKSDLSVQGIKMYVYDHTDGVEDWDPAFAWHDFGVIGTNIRLELDGLLRSKHMDDDYFIDVLLISDDASDFSTGIDVELHADDVYVESYSTDVVHIGGDTDAWIHDSNGLDYLTFDIANISTKEWLISSNSKISGNFWLPIMLIKEIEVISTGAILIPITDWTLFVYKEDWRFAAREENYLTFRSGLSGLDVRVKFHTFSNIQAADIMLQSHLNEPTAYDIMARSRIPNEVFADIDVVASITAAEVMAFAVNFIASQQRPTISMTDINIYLQSIEGISDANVTALYAWKHALSGTVTVLSSVDGVLTLGNPEVEQFVAVNDSTHFNVMVT